MKPTGHNLLPIFIVAWSSGQCLHLIPADGDHGCQVFVLNLKLDVPFHKFDLMRDVSAWNRHNSRGDSHSRFIFHSAPGYGSEKSEMERT